MRSDRPTSASPARRLRPIEDRDPLFGGQEPAADPAHGQPLQRGHETDDLTAVAGLVALDQVVPRGPRHPHLPGGGHDAPAALTQLQNR